MEIANAKILWNEHGPIRVVSQDAKETAADMALMNSYGACNAEWNETDDNGRMLLLLRLFVQITISYGVSPDEVHKAFLSIDEYNNMFSYMN